MHVVLACVVAAALGGVGQQAAGAESAALRGLRAQGLIDFAPVGGLRVGVPEWQPGDTAGQGTPQPSALYGLREQTAAARPGRYAYEIGEGVTGVVESGPALAANPYLPQNALSGQVVRSFSNGVGVGVGLRQKAAGENLLAVAVQKEWGPVRGGYTLYSGGADPAAAAAHRFQLNLDYGNRNSIGLSYTAGREFQVGAMPYSAAVESRDLALSGYHWLSSQWAVTYDVVNSDQAAYHRQGLRFGIRHTF
jgi:YaiO family outer membrane protein